MNNLEELKIISKLTKLKVKCIKNHCNKFYLYLNKNKSINKLILSEYTNKNENNQKIYSNLNLKLSEIDKKNNLLEFTLEDYSTFIKPYSDKKIINIIKDFKLEAQNIANKKYLNQIEYSFLDTISQTLTKSTSKFNKLFNILKENYKNPKFIYYLETFDIKINKNTLKIDAYWR